MAYYALTAKINPEHLLPATGILMQQA